MTRRSNTPYIISIVVFVIACLVAITVVTIYRPDKDNTALFTQIFGFMTMVTVSFLAFIKINEGVDVTHQAKEIAIESKVVQEHTNQLMNSRMTEMMEIVRKLALAEGEKTGAEAGRVQEVQRVLDLSDKLQEGRDQVTEEAQIQKDIDEA